MGVMQRWILTLVAACAVGLAGQAANAIPAEVMTAYRAYMAAIEADDLQGALPHAEEAYQAGVRARIDDETLAALAVNRAQLHFDLQDFARAGPAWDDAIVLIRRTGADRELMDDALFSAAFAHHVAGNSSGVASRARAYLDYASAFGPTQNVYVAHSLIAMSEWSSSRIRQAGRAAEDALRVAEQIGPEVNTTNMLLAKMAAIAHALRRNRVDAAYFLTLSTDYSAALGDADPEHHAMSAWLNYMRRNLTDRQRQDLFDRTLASPLFDFDMPERPQPEPWGEGIVTAVDAVPRRRATPSYPEQAQMQGMEGLAMVQFDVSSDGRTENIEVIFSLPNSVFGAEAARAVRQWRYDPATIDGQPVRRVGVQTHFDFSLQ